MAITYLFVAYSYFVLLLYFARRILYLAVSFVSNILSAGYFNSSRNYHHAACMLHAHHCLTSANSYSTHNQFSTKLFLVASVANCRPPFGCRCRPRHRIITLFVIKIFFAIFVFESSFLSPEFVLELVVNCHFFSYPIFTYAYPASPHNKEHNTVCSPPDGVLSQFSVFHFFLDFFFFFSFASSPNVLLAVLHIRLAHFRHCLFDAYAFR